MADIETFLRELIEKIGCDLNFQKYDLLIKNLKCEGANFTSVLFLLTVKLADGKNVELFAKVACIGKSIRSILNVTKAYNLEMFFYNKLSKVYRELELKQELSEGHRFVFPKFFGCSKQLYKETIILENLLAEGFVTFSRSECIDWDHAASSIEALAKFHALSFAYEKTNPEEFEEVCKYLTYIKPDVRESFDAVWNKWVERGLMLVKEEYRSKIVRLLENMGIEAFTMSNRPLEKNVIVHGDFRPSNFLYKRQEGKLSAILVDYQAIHTGSPAMDLIYFELCCTDSKFRAKNHDRLVDHYYNELSAAMQRLGVDATEQYPRELLNKELKQLLPLFIYLGLCRLPLILVDVDQIPKLDGEEGWASFLVPSSDLFAERFAGIVEDCVRWGII